MFVVVLGVFAEIPENTEKHEKHVFTRKEKTETQLTQHRDT